jgi:Flp pilus assembly pilin Flp
MEMWEGRVLRHIKVFWQCEQAQDLVEYALLVAFICLSGAAFFIGIGEVTSGIWGVVNTRLAASNNAS